MASRKLVISINAAWNIYNFRSGLVRALVEAGYEVLAVAPFDDYAPRLAAVAGYPPWKICREPAAVAFRIIEEEKVVRVTAIEQRKSRKYDEFYQ